MRSGAEAEGRETFELRIENISSVCVIYFRQNGRASLLIYKRRGYI